MTPEIVDRVDQPYVAIQKLVTMDTIPEIADRLREVFGWLAERGIAPVDAPFFRYNVIDMEANHLDMEAGVPIDAVVSGEGDIISGVLPGGRYATVTHTGHPSELIGVTAQLLEWAHERKLAWDMVDMPSGERWGCRLEVLLTDPDVQPDLSRWQTRLQFRLAH
ncbi:GyrI-like domain-containing protein [Kibdelosporangium lantanae]